MRTKWMSWLFSSKSCSIYHCQTCSDKASAILMSWQNGIFFYFNAILSIFLLYVTFIYCKNLHHDTMSSYFHFPRRSPIAVIYSAPFEKHLKWRLNALQKITRKCILEWSPNFIAVFISVDDHDLTIIQQENVVQNHEAAVERVQMERLCKFVRPLLVLHEDGAGDEYHNAPASRNRLAVARLGFVLRVWQCTQCRDYLLGASVLFALKRHETIAAVQVG